MAEGFRDFASGEVLTAANVDDYLMRQTTMRFDTAAARDTALSGVLVEGLRAYTKDTNRNWVYTGSAWALLPTTNAPRCLATRTALQAILPATITPISLTAADTYDTDAMHDPASNASRVILPFIGMWRIHWGVYFPAVTLIQDGWIALNTAGAGTGARYAWNGAAGDSGAAGPKGAGVDLVTTAATDYVELFVYCTSAQNVGGTGISHDIWVQAVYAGPIF